MLRRIFFVIPDVPHAKRIVKELEKAGIEWEQMHASSNPRVKLSGLPAATVAQNRDLVWALDKLFWRADLVLFALATLGLAAALYSGSLIWAALSAAVMLGTFLLGNWFSVKLPHTHLGDMRVPLNHGEVVLMVDVPLNRVREIEQLVSRHHPEAEVGGVGWTSPLLGT